jgi:glycosyltransferase involved in cell wall biosynthesis
MKSLVLFFRKPVPHFFSIEKIFSSVSEQLEKEISIKKSSLPFYTSSVSNIVKNLLFARQQKADVYHVTGDVHYVVLALPKRQVVLTIHDCIFLYQYSGLKKWFFHHLFLKWPVKHSSIITTISEQSKSEIIKFSGCAPEKIRVINNPVTASIYFKPRIFKQEKPTLLFLGSTPNKNLPRVIEAVKGLPCRVHVIGKIPGEQEQNLKDSEIEYVQSSGLSENELADAYAASDILLFPTLYEGFGLPILEAQKAGRPVITSDLSPMKEVAGGAAHLVNPYQVASIRKGIVKIINEQEYRNLLIKKGFENVQRFEPAWVAEQYLEVYKQIAAQEK